MAAVMIGTGGRVVGFIDIGTYSMRLLLARINPNQSFTILSEQKESVRLGGDEFADNRLQPEAMERSALVCRKFVEMAKSFEADPIVAVATAATREAVNQRQFVRLLQREAGIEVRVISGKEEARLIYLGVVSGIHLDKQTGLFIDIGGGSTELAIGTTEDFSFLDSLKLGSIRVSQMFHLDDPEGVITPRRYGRVKRFVRNTAIRAIQSIKERHYDVVTGSSGTLLNLGQIAAAALHGKAGEVETTLTRQDLKQIAKMLCGLPLAERRKVPGINTDRADIILGGMAIAETLMEELGIDTLRTSKRGLRDGLLVNYLAASEHAGLVNDLPTRKRSVLLLGRRCGFDEEHAMTVARLTMQLFDSAQDAGLINYGERERELLEYAALLHDVGVFLSFVNHQAHTYYLIRHADLVGFDEKEIALIAALARFHRKGLPRKTQHEMAGLDKPSLKMVGRLFIFLRLAESLERSHSGVVREVKLIKGDGDNAILKVYSPHDCTLELWGVERHRKAFGKALGCGMMVEAEKGAVSEEAEAAIKQVQA